MTETTIILDSIEPRTLYGRTGEHLAVLRGLFPRLRVAAHGAELRVLGSEADIEAFTHAADALCRHIAQYNAITDEDIIAIVRGGHAATTATEAVAYTLGGKPITPRTEGQRRLIEAYATNDLVFAVGPAGTGKTYLSVALAVRALKERTAKKIILSRPAVEAGEKLGFLPGDMKTKIDPYLQPLYDALEDMLPAAKLGDMLDKHTIQIAPLAFMRGRTLSDAVVILDEAQNTTTAQIRMFLTRMGWNTKMIVTGDLTQVDLPGGQRSGLRDAVDTLTGIAGIATVRLTEKDIIRNRLVTKIVEAYDKKSTNNTKI